MIFTKSAKSKVCEGVCGPPKPERRPIPPPGVVIIEEGRARGFEGGVWGGCMRLLRGWAGEGEVAR